MPCMLLQEHVNGNVVGLQKKLPNNRACTVLQQLKPLLEGEGLVSTNVACERCVLKLVALGVAGA